MAIDAQGNIYLVGGVSSADFPTTPGAYDVTYNTGGSELGSHGNTDAFVTKLNSQGQIVWSTYLGGPNYDRAYAVEVDAAGAVYVAGRAGNGFPTTAGALQTTFAGDSNPNSIYGKQDGFVTKLSADGSSLIWSTYFGDAGRGFVRDIDIDASGRVYVAATNVQKAVPYITGDAEQSTLKGGSDNVYARLSSDGTTVLYGTYIGGTDVGSGFSGNPSIRVDKNNNNVYFMTYDPADDVGATPGAFQTTRAGDYDLVISRFDSSDNLVYRTYLGGSKFEGLETHTLAIDSLGRAYVGGETDSNDFPVTTGTVQTSFGESGVPKGDGFVSILSADGATLIASTYLGGAGREEVEGINLTADGKIVASGPTSSASLPTTADAEQSALRGVTDAFVAIVSSDLTELIYLSYYGGDGRDEARASAVGPTGEVVIAGQTTSGNFPVLDAFDNQLNGQYAAFYTVFVAP